MSKLYIQVGKKIRLYRKARSLTQEELGEYLEIDQSYLGRIERGEINITLDTLYKISKALRIHPAQLLEDEKHVSDEDLRSEILDKIDTLLIPLTNDELQRVHRLLKEVLALKNINKSKRS
ncbi:helix-turn-helix transcriptional regulator [Paenibacillus lautus]|uniref:helix-turn-helix domain-containing protein n=1 Tax=Paenibacillus TaxID=44249 RepID=UPI002FBDA588